MNLFNEVDATRPTFVGLYLSFPFFLTLEGWPEVFKLLKYKIKLPGN